MPAPQKHLRPVKAAGRDPFAMEASSYDPAEFYIDHIDKRGHRDRFQVSVPQGTAGAIEHVVREIEAYRGRGDFIADAIHHRLQWCYEQMGQPADIGRTLTADRIKSRAAQRTREITDNKEAVEELTHLMDVASGMRDDRALLAAVQMAVDAAEEMDDPYRGQIMEAVRRYQK